MAEGYLLLVGRPDAVEATSAMAASVALRNGWTATAVGSRSHVLVDPGRMPPLIVGKAVAVIGHLFPRHGPPGAQRTLDEADLRGLDMWGEDYLIERYWGDYVALIDMADEPCVLRGPLSASPCFVVDGKTVTAFASDADTMVRAGLLEPQIAWAQVARALYRPDLPGRVTALHGLSELPPGDVAQVGGNTVTCSRWSPWTFAFPNQLEPDDDRLARAVLSSVSNWAAAYGRVLAGISGGLDSSIVAASLRASGTDFSCLTLATSDPSGDERAFARAIASHLGAALIERWYDPDVIDLDRPVAAHLPRPGGHIHENAYHRVRYQVAREVGADAFFTGNGGDNVFYNTSSVRPVLDRFRAQGLQVGVLRTAMSLASLTGASLSSVLIGAVRLAPRANHYDWPRDDRFLTRAALELASTAAPRHPWLSAPRGALPGKLGHIAMLLRMQHHLDPGVPGAPCPLVNPLASQPVVECCLGIPSWRAVEDGTDRAPARRAFAGRLPRAVLERRDKGTPEGLVIALLKSRPEVVRHRLLDGLLAKQGLVDRAALEEATRSGAMGQGGDGPRLMKLLDAEAWCRAWQARAGAALWP